MAAQNSGLMQKWGSLSLTTRSLLAVLGVMGFVMVGVYAVGGVSNEPLVARPNKSTPSSSNLRLGSTKSDTGEKVAGRMDAAQNQIVELRRSLEQEKADATKRQAALMEEIEKLRTSGSSGPGAGVNADLIESVRRLSEELRELKEKGGVTAAPALDSPLPGGGVARVSEAPGPARPTLKSFGGKDSSATATVAKDGDHDLRTRKTGRESLAYLPAGSMFEAVLMNGAYAPTNSVARRNPVPMLLRVHSDAILPNRLRQDIRECFVIISGYGELASERLLGRTEILSCALTDGRVAEAKLEGYIVGEDGKLGMQGQLVSRQGQRIAQALAAGGLAGIAKGLQPFQVPQLSISGSGGNASVGAGSSSLDQVLQSGAAGGLADTARAVSQFYLDTAKEMYPVVSIDSLRKATIILTKGFELRG